MTYYMTSTYYVDSDDLSVHVVGTELGDTILAGGGNDFVEGGGGNDDINGGRDSDYLDGGADNDSLRGWDGNDELYGGAGDDFLYGDDNDHAYAGNDTLVGGTGNDNLYGGRGSDTYIYNVGDGSDTIYNRATYQADDGATDVLVFGSGISPSDVVLTRGSNGINQNHLFISFTGSSEVITLQNYFSSEGLDGHAVDEIHFADSTVWNIATVKAMVLTGTEGDDTIRGYASDDVIDAKGGNDIVYGNGGNDTIHGGTGNDSLLSGGDDNDTIYGDSGNDNLFGENGNDTLDGGTGIDNLFGGAGNDTYIVDNVDDVVHEDSGAGTDSVQAGVTHTLGGNVENLTLTGSSTINGTGNGLDNVLVGNSAANVLDAGAGNDTLQGKGGNDTLIGGTGSDTFLFDLGDGQDTINDSDVAGGKIDALQFGAGIALSQLNFVRTGNALIVSITGTSDSVRIENYFNADDSLSGKNINEIRLAGGTTLNVDDVYLRLPIIGDDTDQVIYGTVHSDTIDAKGGNDTVYGLESNDNIQGGSGNDTIYGGDGNDTIFGGIGNDILDGGNGADSLTGDAGNDTYVVDNAGDTVTEAASAGTDTVQASISYTLTSNVENLTLTGSGAINGTGNSLNNTIIGNSADNVLDGGAGYDSLRGGVGNDTYYVTYGDVVVENSGEGTDLVLVSDSYTMDGNIENLTLLASGYQGIGNELDNIMIGNAGNNTLIGGAGNDTMNGGQGSDTYGVDSVGDVIVDDGGGADMVQSSISYTLASGLEHLTLQGTADLNGTGNASDNFITGNSGANILTGGAGNDRLNGGEGADTLIGGSGNDTYWIDNVGDTITENAGEGTDDVTSSISYTLSANVENLHFFATTGAVTGTGNAQDNRITGGYGNRYGGAGNDWLDTSWGGNTNDYLDGGTGMDTLIGGAGNDTYIVDNIYDVVNENASAGTDVVQASVTHTLAANVENLTLTGTDAINGTGNALGNVLTGNSAANTLTGGAGNDTYVFNAGFGGDTVVENDSTSGNTDQANFGTGINHDQLWFTHSGNDLVVQRIGTSDTVVFSNWYSGSANHVEQFHSGNGKTLVDSQVESLVSAMASLTPPGTGETTLSQAYQDQLASTLAASWA